MSFKRVYLWYLQVFEEGGPFKSLATNETKQIVTQITGKE